MPKRKVILTSVLLVGAAVATWVFAARRVVPLTEEETLGAVFIGLGDSNLMPIFHNAHPAALPKLRVLLTHPEIAEYHGNIMAMLGQIGDASDAQRIEDYILALEGDISDKPQLGGYTMGLYALARKRRGIAPAMEILRHMSEPAYWAKIRFVQYPDRGPESWDLDMKMSLAFTAYAAAGAPDMAARYTTWLNSLPTKDQHQRYNVDLKERAKYPEYMRKAEQAPIPNDIRRTLLTLFNGSMTAPGRPGARLAPPPPLSMPAPPPEAVAERSLVIARLLEEVPHYSAAAIVQYTSDWRQGTRSTVFVKQVPPETKGDLYRMRGLITLYKPVFGISDLPASGQIDAELRDPTASETSDLHRRLFTLAAMDDENARSILIVLYKSGGWLDSMFVGPIRLTEYRQAAETVAYIKAHPKMDPGQADLLGKSDNPWMRELAEHFLRHPG